MNSGDKKRFSFVVISSILVFLYAASYKFLIYKISGFITLPIGAVIWLTYFCAIVVSLVFLLRAKTIGVKALFPLAIVVITFFLIRIVPFTDYGAADEYFAKHNANIPEIENDFFVNKQSYELLKERIEEDAASADIKDCIEVRSDYKTEFISEARYQSYLSLFEITNSTGVSFCSAPAGRILIVVHSTGFVFGGCLTSINVYEDTRVPNSEMETKIKKEITPLEDGWFISHDCN